MIEYAGSSGSPQCCLRAIVRFVHFGDEITEVKVLSSKKKVLSPTSEHCFLFLVNGNYVAIKSGFRSGYMGVGPRGLINAIKILKNYNNVEIFNCDVSYEIIKRIDESCLLNSDIEYIQNRKSNFTPLLRSKLGNWLLSENYYDDTHIQEIKEIFPTTIAFSLIDERIMDLALNYKNNPDESIGTGYKRLEELVRKRTGLKEIGIKLFNKAFVEKDCKLTWDNPDDSHVNENQGKALFFKSIFMAYRNPRMHKEIELDDADLLREFMLMNQLFVLEGESKEKPIDCTKK